MYRIVYPFDPDNLDAKHSPFVEDLIQMRRNEQREALLEISKMIAALKSLGLQCGFTKKLHGTPLYELKRIREVVKKAVRERIYFALQTTSSWSVTRNVKMATTQIQIYSRTPRISSSPLKQTEQCFQRG